MLIAIDIETIPDQREGAYEAFLKDATENFKAPSGLSKKQALLDMGLDGNREPPKYWTKDETISQWVKFFKGSEKVNEVAEKNYRDTSFDGGKGEIVSIAYGRIDDGIVKAQYRELREFNSGITESALLTTVFQDIMKLCQGVDHTSAAYFAGHNIAFDLRFMFRRAVILGLQPPFELPFNGRHGSQYYDTMQGWSGYKDTISQNNLARALGIPEKPDDIDGSKVWDFVKRGDAKRVSEYNVYDVETVIDIYNKLTFSGPRNEQLSN